MSSDVSHIRVIYFWQELPNHHGHTPKEASELFKLATSSPAESLNTPCSDHVDRDHVDHVPSSSAELRPRRPCPERLCRAPTTSTTDHVDHVLTDHVDHDQVDHVPSGSPEL